MKEESDIDSLIKDLQEFESENINKILNKHKCSNCGNVTEQLQVQKNGNEDLDFLIQEIKRFRFEVDEHNRNLKSKLFGLIKSDERWELVTDKIASVFVREVGENLFTWIKLYRIYFNYRECYVTCPLCGTKKYFHIKKE